LADNYLVSENKNAEKRSESSFNVSFVLSKKIEDMMAIEPSGVC
jgi:hypothetical protein